MAAPKGNKYAIGNRGGRPPKFKTPDDLAKKIDSYFEYIHGDKETKMMNVLNPLTNETELKEVTKWKREPEKPRIFALLLFLGFQSLQAFNSYEEKDKEFLRVIELGKSRVADWYESNLMERGNRGAAFALSNLVGWGNRTDQGFRGADGKPINPPANAVILTNVMPDANKDL